MINELIKKADILVESLSYIRTFRSKTFVVKYGGAAMNDETLKKEVVKDLVLLKYIGINPVIVHGGGPAISSQLERAGISSRFVNGLRITDRETMKVVQMVLVGSINQEIVGLLNLYGGSGVGLSGKDADLIVARKKPPELVYNPDEKREERVDLGYVGEIEKINPELLLSLCDKGFIPVISPLGVGLDGESYNVNADEAAGEIAQALQAEKLIMLSDVDGVYEIEGNPATKIPVIPANKALNMIENKQIRGGMIPKIKACAAAVTNGVGRTHIIDGREKHSLLLEIFTDQGIGTMVTGG